MFLSALTLSQPFVTHVDRLETLSWFSPIRKQRTTWPLYHLSPWWCREDNGKKKAKLVGWNKDSLTEPQRKRAVTTIILIRGIYKKKEYTEELCLSVQCPVHSSAEINLSTSLLPHSKLSMMSHGIKYPIGWAGLGQPSRLCPFLTSCEN